MAARCQPSHRPTSSLWTFPMPLTDSIDTSTVSHVAQWFRGFAACQPSPTARLLCRLSRSLAYHVVTLPEFLNLSATAPFQVQFGSGGARIFLAIWGSCPSQSRSCKDPAPNEQIHLTAQVLQACLVGCHESLHITTWTSIRTLQV